MTNPTLPKVGDLHEDAANRRRWPDRTETRGARRVRSVGALVLLVLLAVLLASCGSGNDVLYTEDEGPRNIGNPYIGLLAGENPPQKIFWTTLTLENPPDGVAESLDAETAGTGITKSYDPATGVLRLDGEDAPISEWAEVLGTVTYTNTSQNPTYSRNVKFAMRVVANDGTEINPFTGTQRIFVQAVNDAPIANEDPGSGAPPYSTDEDSALGVGTQDGLLKNDTDVDDDAGDLGVADGDTSDTDAAGEVDPVSGPANGTLTLGRDGSFTYTPDPNFNGTDGFTYKASDGSANSGEATVAITVNAVSDPPTISPIEDQTTDEDTPTPALVLDVGDDETPAANLALAGASNNPSLIPDANITFGGSGTSRTVSVSPASGESGTATITIAVTDTQGLVASESFQLTVAPVNDVPVAGADAYRTDEDQDLKVPISSGLLSNDTDADGDPLSTRLVRGPKKGKLTLRGDGSFTYDPKPDANGADSFVYRASDGRADSGAVVVDIVVRPVADPPSPEVPPCTIKGTNGNDNALTGTSGADVICAFGGNDVVDAGGGNDTIYAGPGKDVVTGGEGKDELYGQDGIDVLRTRDGVRGNDLADGGPGGDACSYDPGDRRVSCP